MLFQFQELGEITIHGKAMIIRTGRCYRVSLSNKQGWLRIDKMWTYDDVLKMEATCFTRPSVNRYRRFEIGMVSMDYRGHPAGNIAKKKSEGVRFCFVPYCQKYTPTDCFFLSASCSV